MCYNNNLEVMCMSHCQILVSKFVINNCEAGNYLDAGEILLTMSGSDKGNEIKHEIKQQVSIILVPCAFENDRQ